MIQRHHQLNLGFSFQNIAVNRVLGYVTFSYSVFSYKYKSLRLAKLSKVNGQGKGCDPEIFPISQDKCQ